MLGSSIKGTRNNVSRRCFLANLIHSKINCNYCNDNLNNNTHDPADLDERL